VYGREGSLVLDIDTIVKTVLGSTAAEWVVFEEMADPETSHWYHAAYSPDAAIWLDWGRYCVRNFHEDWIEHFASKDANSFYVDCFYSGNLVARTVLVSVDGGRAVLPIGVLRNRVNGYEVEVELENEGWARLIHALQYPATEFDGYFSRARMKRV
jgi:hypothetical protein